MADSTAPREREAMDTPWGEKMSKALAALTTATRDDRVTWMLDGGSPSECFERAATLFAADTGGLMPIGKDDPFSPATHDTRGALWMMWRRHHGV